MRARSGWTLLGLLLLGTPSAQAQIHPAQPVVEEIRREAIKKNNDPEGRPLPLASHWARGFGERNFSSGYQVALLEQGHHVLPNLPMPTPGAGPYNERGEHVLRTLAALKAPFSLRADQWENMLLSKHHPAHQPGKWRTLPPEQNPLVLAPNGTLLNLLSPFGAVEPWYEVGRYYTQSNAFSQLQAWYPDPPLVLLLSNNEALRLTPKNDVVRKSQRFAEAHGTKPSKAFIRGAMADGYRERYGALFNGLKDGIENDTWRANAIVVGYKAFGPPHFGRRRNWSDYSYATEERIDPWHLVWDGGSVAYYTHIWNASTDYKVNSPQIEAMNLVFMLDEAYRENPDFWFELSVWDGNNGNRTDRNKPLDKAEHYRRTGQTWSPERYAGYVQYGMWLTTPRVVREFRGHHVPRTLFIGEYEALVAAVDRVWTNPVLTRFWRKGRLVPNRRRLHPFDARIPEQWKDVDRWFMLNTNLDIPGYWPHNREIPVFSLARVLGEPGQREWLVYAQAPLRAYQDIQVEIPDYTTVTIDVYPAGAFYHVRESDGAVIEVIDDR